MALKKHTVLEHPLEWGYHLPTPAWLLETVLIVEGEADHLVARDVFYGNAPTEAQQARYRTVQLDLIDAHLELHCQCD